MHRTSKASQNCGSNRKTKVTLKDCKKEHFSQLHLDVLAGRKDRIAQELQKSNVDLADKNGISPLGWACILGNADIAKQLIQANADVNSGTPKTFWQSFLRRNSQNTYSPLNLASLGGHADIIELLLEHGANIDSQNKSDGSIPLTSAASSDNVNAIEILLRKGAEIDSRNKNGDTALMVAMANGQHNVVQLLCQAGAKVYAPQYTIGSEQLSQMTRTQFWEHVSDVFQKNPFLQKIEVEGQGTFDRTELNGLITLKLLSEPQKLHNLVTNLKSAALSFNDCKEEDFTPLHRHILLEENDLIATDLQTIAVDTLDKKGISPLGWACIVKNAALAKQLIQAKANVNFGAASGGWKDIFKGPGASPLNLAAIRGDLNIVQLLLEHGADVHAQNNEDGAIPLTSAATSGNVAVLELLLEKGVQVDSKNKKGQTALMCAACHNHVDAVQFLLQKGADVNAQDNEGLTPLSFAAFWGHINVLELLLQKGAQVNAQDKKGQTALILAASGGKPEVIELLLQNGASLQSVSDNGTALYILNNYKPAKWKESKRVIESFSCAKLIAEVKDFDKLYGGTTLLSHAYAVKGTSLIQGHKLELEGTTSEHPAATLASSIQGFAKAFPGVLDIPSARHLAQALHFASDKKSHTAKESLQKIKSGRPTLFFAGYLKRSDGQVEWTHAAAILIWSDIFIECDRGGYTTSALNVHRFNPKKFTEKHAQLLLDIHKQEHAEYSKALKETLVNEIGLTQSENELELQKLAALPLQEVGNCSWASKEGAFKAFLLLDKLKDTFFELPKDNEEKNELKKSLDSTFNSWLIYQRLELLDKYLDNPVDKELVFKSFNSLWAAKITETTLIKRIMALEDKYQSVATGADYQAYVTNKIMCSIFPGDFTRFLQYLNLNPILALE